MRRPTVLDRFLSACERFPDRPALEVQGRTWTYAELRAYAAGIADELRREREAGPIGLWGRRNFTAYAGILGCWMAGRGYVTLSPALPDSRLQTLWESASPAALVVDDEDRETARRRLGEGTVRVPLLSASRTSVPDVSPVSDDALAYLFYTSGTTGKPKGVPISQRNVAAYVDAMAPIAGANETDRFSQIVDLGFDLSVHEMALCWSAGAVLCVDSDGSRLAQAHMLKAKRITMALLVPSAAAALARLRLAKPGAFPDMRAIFFCGEPLSRELATIWQQAGPHARIENIYGPTETTIAITRHRFDAAEASPEGSLGYVAIGRPLGDNTAILVDNELNPVTDGHAGELLLAGPQIAGGYWKDPAATASRFVTLASGGERVWYRTGDLARRDSAGALWFLGRVDAEMKVRGHRVDPAEIELVVREMTGSQQAVAVPWNVRDGSAEGVVAFHVGGRPAPPEGWLRPCADKLPSYVSLQAVIELSELPLTVNGKIDRPALVQLAKERINHGQ